MTFLYTDLIDTMMEIQSIENRIDVSNEYGIHVPGSLTKALSIMTMEQRVQISSFL